MRTLLVTGGAGFIGSHLCEKLLNSGYRVVCLDSFNDFYAPLMKEQNVLEILKTAKISKTLEISKTIEIPKMAEALQANDISRFTLIRGDIRDIDCLHRVFSEHEIHAVVHLAAYAGVRPSIQNPALYYDVNVTGTLNLLEAMRKAGVKSFVFASSSSVYGNNEKVPFSETDSVDNPISPYAATKKAGELMCHAWHHLFGISVACLRFFTVYGPRQRPDLAIRKFTEMLKRGEELPVFGDGSTERDYTYVMDIIDGVERALKWTMEHEHVYEIFNLGESQTVSLNRMIGGIEAALGVTARIGRLPEQPGDVKCTFADITKAKQMLGYAPSMKYEDGVKVFVEWMERQKRA
jgi:UDP-glucuronate 4-epimerase